MELQQINRDIYLDKLAHAFDETFFTQGLRPVL